MFLVFIVMNFPSMFSCTSNHISHFPWGTMENWTGSPVKILAVVGHAKRWKFIGLVSADAGRLSNSSAFAQAGMRMNGNAFRALGHASTMRGNFPFSYPFTSLGLLFSHCSFSFTSPRPLYLTLLGDYPALLHFFHAEAPSSWDLCVKLPFKAFPFYFFFQIICRIKKGIDAIILD